MLLRPHGLLVLLVLLRPRGLMVLLGPRRLLVLLGPRRLLVLLGPRRLLVVLIGRLPLRRRMRHIRTRGQLLPRPVLRGRAGPMTLRRGRAARQWWRWLRRWWSRVGTAGGVGGLPLVLPAAPEET
ncbi:hypothetical protein [Streptomyces sp. NPDC018833]|uniref:hypothetical protein n=1 Tax=Streptomyces sp. NPDC018833 TaxID=3365053 RepID=UPI0037A76659